MKNRLLTLILCAVMLLAFAAGFAGCSDGKSADEPEGVDKYVGKWIVNKVKVAGSDEVKTFGELFDGEFSIKFGEDGFCDYTILNENFKHTKWEIIDGRIKIHDHRGIYPYLDDNGDGTLSLEYDDGNVYIFERYD